MPMPPLDCRVLDRLLARPRHALRQLAICALLYLQMQPGFGQAAPPSTDADAGPDSCGIEAAPDPRLEQLLLADPDSDEIDVTSDQGELGRNGDAVLSGNVTIRMGQRLLTADEA